jgi:hypothetical protein
VNRRTKIDFFINIIVIFLTEIYITSTEPMDPIDRVASVFTLYCREVLHGMIEMQRIVDASPTTGEAVTALVRMGYFPSIDKVDLNTAMIEIPRIRRCLISMNDIKQLARRVFVCNFSEEDQYFVFSQEISFSFAAKMLVSMGLRLCHFSNNPTTDEIVRAEISLAMNSPIISDVIASVPPPAAAPTNNAAVVVTIAKRPPRPVIARMKKTIPPPPMDLTCREPMPTTKQIRLPPRHPLATSYRR